MTDELTLRETLRELEAQIQTIIDAETDDFFALAKIMNRDPLKDFAGTDLHNTDLSKGELSGANLSNTNLSGANLSGADLSNANLSGADLSYANLSRANLSNIKFQGTNVKNCQFDNVLGLSISEKKDLEKRGAIFDRVDTKIDEEAIADNPQLKVQIKQQIEKRILAEISSEKTEEIKDFVPSSLLEEIAEQAEQIAPANLSPLDKLVACAHPFLYQWDVEDIEVFARPLVYEMMRGENIRFDKTPWDKLSTIEQVRRILKITQYALDSSCLENKQTQLTKDFL